MEGHVYEGEFKHNKKHGKGIFRHADGSFYDGKWKDDKAHSQGTLKYVNGDFYEGGWRYNKFHGKGTLNRQHAFGYIYKGGFKDNNMHGKGMIWTNDGQVYKGEWNHGMFQGGSRILPKPEQQLTQLPALKLPGAAAGDMSPTSIGRLSLDAHTIDDAPSDDINVGTLREGLLAA